ncbi:hypothetical protein JVU11DRAFT_10155 [Chiua virens]|nr:hypothetical protein JVU11DRAFT_10155 [Chiua virens]
MNMWVWTGGYLKSLSPVPKANLSVQGSLTEPVNPSVVAASEYLPNEHRTEVNSRDITWALKEDVLEAASTTIWKRLDDLKVPISSITLLSGRYDGFPYSKDDGTPALLCAEAAQALSEANVTNTEVLCALCHKPTSDLWSHMGGHILHSIRRVPDELVTPVGQVLPCGFCGSSGNPDCAIKLKKTKRATEVITNCPHKVPFKYGFTEKGSESRPCRNVPVVCGLCPHRERKTDAKPAIWRYNMEEHLSLSHPEYAHPGKIYGLPLPLHMIDTVVITVQEEKKFSVPARSNPDKPSSTHTANHQSTHPPAPTSSGQKRQADVQAGQFRLIISSSNGTKRARMARLIIAFLCTFFEMPLQFFHFVCYTATLLQHYCRFSVHSRSFCPRCRCVPAVTGSRHTDATHLRSNPNMYILRDNKTKSVVIVTVTGGWSPPKKLRVRCRDGVLRTPLGVTSGNHQYSPRWLPRSGLARQNVKL